MDTTLSPTAVEPNNAVAAAADERLKHAYQQIASADEQLARVTKQLSRLEHDATYQTSAVPGRQRSRGRPALRGFIGLLMAACIVGAALVSQSSSGDATKQIIARWLPPVLASSVPLERPEPRARLNPVQVAAAEPTAVPASSPAPVAPQDAASTGSPPPPELAQLLQTISRDIADVEQKIEQLKATQAQVASDNAKAIGELKASQEQMTSLIAKASEPHPQPKTSSVSSSAASARPVAATPRQPTPIHASTQARSQSPAVVRSPRQEQ